MVCGRHLRSPDGWSDVWAMDATTGFNAGRLTDDEWTDTAPVLGRWGVGGVLQLSRSGVRRHSRCRRIGDGAARGMGRGAARLQLQHRNAAERPVAAVGLAARSRPLGHVGVLPVAHPGWPPHRGATGWNCGAVHRDRRPAHRSVDHDDRLQRTATSSRLPSPNRSFRPGGPAARPFDVTTVIVNWNTVDLLDDCLASVAAEIPDGFTHQVVVVDNGSRDGSAEWPVPDTPTSR